MSKGNAYHQKKDKPHASRRYGEEDVKRWRSILRNERISQAALAKREGVGETTITKLLQEY